MTKQTKLTLLLALGFLLLSLTLIALQFTRMTDANVRMNGIDIAGAYVTAPPVGRTFAAYMSITAADADTLISASSPRAGRVEFHDHVFIGDLVRMPKLARIELRPRVRTTLQPGGLHLMLLDVVPQVAVGDSLTLRLRFEKAGEIELKLPVRAAGGSHAH